MKFSDIFDPFCFSIQVKQTPFRPEEMISIYAEAFQHCPKTELSF
jgi:hypothetical protein